jgi:hypothetical protein
MITLLPEDRERIQSPKRFVLNKKTRLWIMSKNRIIVHISELSRDKNVEDTIFILNMNKEFLYRKVTNSTNIKYINANWKIRWGKY